LGKLTKEKLAEESILVELEAQLEELREKARIKEILSTKPKKQKVILYSTLSNSSKSDKKSYEDKVIEELREKKFPYVTFEELRDNKIIQMAVNAIIADSKRR